jgi:hypothetical protein
VSEKQKVVEYLVNPTLPIPSHKKICIELMDEMLFNAFGFHFLEPIEIERSVVKVIPKLHSVRKTSMVVQSPHVNPHPLAPTGRSAN